MGVCLCPRISIGCWRVSIPIEHVCALTLLVCTVLHGDVGDETSNEEKEAGEEDNGEDEILRRIVDDGPLKGR